MPKDMIPTEGMFFDSEEDAYEFFRCYAEKCGFPIRYDRSKLSVREILCAMAGRSKFHKPNQQRVRNKFSKKTGCKVYIKLKDVEEMDGDYLGKVKIEKVRLDHNHPMAESQRVVQQMRCHKRKDKEVLEYVDHLHESDVPSHCVTTLLSDMYRGEHNLPMTQHDLKNRYVFYYF
jgi:hypothetical protein